MPTLTQIHKLPVLMLKKLLEHNELDIVSLRNILRTGSKSHISAIQNHYQKSWLSMELCVTGDSPDPAGVERFYSSEQLLLADYLNSKKRNAKNTSNSLIPEPMKNNISKLLNWHKNQQENQLSLPLLGALLVSIFSLKKRNTFKKEEDYILQQMLQLHPHLSQTGNEMSLYWHVASTGNHEALKILDKRYGEEYPIDFDECPNASSPFHGVTIAYLLAQHNTLLLPELSLFSTSGVSHDPDKEYLFTSPQHPDHPYENVPLFWWLAYHMNTRPILDHKTSCIIKNASFDYHPPNYPHLSLANMLLRQCKKDPSSPSLPRYSRPEKPDPLVRKILEMLADFLQEKEPSTILIWLYTTRNMQIATLPALAPFLAETKHEALLPLIKKVLARGDLSKEPIYDEPDTLQNVLITLLQDIYYLKHNEHTQTRTQVIRCHLELLQNIILGQPEPETYVDLTTDVPIENVPEGYSIGSLLNLFDKKIAQTVIKKYGFPVDEAWNSDKQRQPRHAKRRNETTIISDSDNEYQPPRAKRRNETIIISDSDEAEKSSHMDIDEHSEEEPGVSLSSSGYSLFTNPARTSTLRPVSYAPKNYGPKR